MNKTIKKIIICAGIIGMLVAPILRQDFPNFLEDIKYYSVVTSLSRDIKEGSFTTHELIYNNIVDRSQEFYNDIVYKK